MKKTIDEYAAQAARETRRWYGSRLYFRAPQGVPLSCEDFWKAHWRQFPASSPDGGEIIDAAAVETVGFIEPPPTASAPR